MFRTLPLVGKTAPLKRDRRRVFVDFIVRVTVYLCPSGEDWIRLRVRAVRLEEEECLAAVVVDIPKRFLGVGVAIGDLRRLDDRADLNLSVCQFGDDAAVPIV